MTSEVAKLFIEMSSDIHSLIRKSEDRNDLNIPVETYCEKFVIKGWRTCCNIPEIEVISDGKVEYISLMRLDSIENGMIVLKELDKTSIIYKNVLANYNALKSKILDKIGDSEDVSEMSLIEDLAYLLKNKLKCK